MGRIQPRMLTVFAVTDVARSKAATKDGRFTINILFSLEKSQAAFRTMRSVVCWVGREDGSKLNVVHGAVDRWGALKYSTSRVTRLPHRQSIILGKKMAILWSADPGYCSLSTRSLRVYFIRLFRKLKPHSHRFLLPNHVSRVSSGRRFVDLLNTCTR